MIDGSEGLRNRRWKEYLLILSFSILLSVIGILLVDDYGLSWDEYRDIKYGEIVSRAYTGDESFRLEDTDRHYYGPFYWVLVNQFHSFVKSFLFNVKAVHIWKISCFFVFQIAVITFYNLCCRNVSRIPALITSLLFMTQPLLWGHAFINQKDIPLMAFFLLSVTLGVYGIDAFHRSLQPEGDILRRNIRGIFLDRWRARMLEWNTAKRPDKKVLITLLILIILFSIELLFLQKLFLPAIQSTVRDAYLGKSIAPINALFERIAQGAEITPVDAYLNTITRVYRLISWLFIVGLALAVSMTCRRIFQPINGDTKQAQSANILCFPLIAGCVLGLTISIRIAGIYAGILISGYFLYKARRKAIIPLIVYWIIAAGVAYATWPYLWGAPIPRVIDSIQEAGSFSSLKTLFQGEIQASENMPAHYLPFLMLVQLTEPAVLLILLGLIVVICKWRRKVVEQAFLLLIGAWIAVPILAEIILQVPIYDNFRQFLFVVPALFLVSSWGVTYLYERLKPKWALVIILVILLLPGIFGIVRLHPYEYVYYNAIVGGVDAAFGEYELDYWCTSLREAMGYLQENASPNATVYISGPVDVAKPYAREDLKIVQDRTLVPYPDYVVACRNVVLSDEFYPDYEVIYEVGIDGGIFSVIKENVNDQG